MSSMLTKLVMEFSDEAYIYREKTSSLKVCQSIDYQTKALFESALQVICSTSERWGKKEMEI